MLLRPSRLAVAVARADHHDVLVLRNELNEHIRPGMLVWGVSKFSAEKKMKEQPSFYAFFIRKMVAPTGDPKEIVVEGEWLHALEYLRRLDKKNVIGDKWQGHNVWFFTKQRQNLEADAVVSVVSAVPGAAPQGRRVAATGTPPSALLTRMPASCGRRRP